jgi:CHASE1-domain containing sensor protein
MAARGAESLGRSFSSPSKTTAFFLLIRRPMSVQGRRWLIATAFARKSI